jgi:hypothetical protein
MIFSFIAVITIIVFILLYLDNSIIDSYALSFNIAAVGDVGCVSKSKDIIDKINNINPEIFLVLGDLSYQSNANCFIDQISTLGINKTKIVLGNHDDGEDEPVNLTTAYLKSFNLKKPYYSFDYGNIHFLVLHTGRESINDNDQYQFANLDLSKTVKNNTIDWIIVLFHKPMYTSFNQCTNFPFYEFRQKYHPIFDDFNVTLVLQAHNHFYERNLPIKFNGDNPIIQTLERNSYNFSKSNNTLSPIFITAGTGGMNLYPIESCSNIAFPKNEYTVERLRSYGFIEIEVDQESLKIKFHDVDNQINRDMFTITK